MNKYSFGSKEAKAIDKAQEKVSLIYLIYSQSCKSTGPHIAFLFQYWCCGATKYYQWNETARFRNEPPQNGNTTTTGDSSQSKVPDSCCKPPILEGCGKVTHPSNINYKVGLLSTF